MICHRTIGPAVLVTANAAGPDGLTHRLSWETPPPRDCIGPPVRCGRKTQQMRAELDADLERRIAALEAK